ncbi:MAG: hypothetical protein IID43_06665 [Planctomycetes bacterium]|nr:hypothetical protein [Planctomycetota bacterium]
MFQRGMMFLATCLLTVSVLANLALAQRVRFDDHKVVQVDLAESEQLEAFRELVVGNTGTAPDQWDIWPEGVIGIGKLDVRVSPAQLRALQEAGFALEVVIDDVQALIDADYAGSADGDEWFEGYHRLSGVEDGILERLQFYADTYPKLAKVVDLGTSVEGRPIRALRITGKGQGQDKPGFFVNGGIHAREWVSPPTTIYIADWLLTQYDSDPKAERLVDGIEWTILPVSNPDGYDYTWTSNRMWRKNRRNNGDGTWGVDLNRNFAYGWGGPGSSGSTGSQIYRGPSPFSEPESRVIRDVLIDHPNVAAFMDFHSYGQMIMWPWGYTAKLNPDNDEYAFVGSNMSRLLREVHGRNYRRGPVYTTIYPASGVTLDWCYGNFMEERLVMSFTTELRGSSFSLPPEQIIPTCEENLPTILFIAEHVAKPALRIDINTEVPRIVAPEQEVRVEIQVIQRRGRHSGEANLFYRTSDGDFTKLPMKSLGELKYEATIPGAPCGTNVHFYVHVTADDGTPFTNPLTAPDETFTYRSAVARTIVHDNFETDLGWTEINLGATSGDWQRGTPVNDPNWDYDPVSDSDGSGQCYLTQNQMGNTDVDDGAVRIISQTIDMSAGNILIGYDYFLYLTRESDRTDFLLVEINSDDGEGQWTLIARHDTNGALAWRSHEITQEYLDDRGVKMTAKMKLRFTANDAYQQSIVEAGLDALLIQTVGCGGGEITCDDVKKFKTSCRKGKLKTITRMTDASHDGQSLGIDINGEPFEVKIRRKKARLVRKRQSGPQTVTLTQPEGCFDPRKFDCG